MSYKSLRDFLESLERSGQLQRVSTAIDPDLEVTEVCLRALKKSGPALLFEHPKGYRIPMVGNLFGHCQRVLTALGIQDSSELREIGEELAFLREPGLPDSLGAAIRGLPKFRRLKGLRPKHLQQASVQEVVLSGDEVDLSELPIQTCWPEDVGKLITWGLVVTKGPHQARQNVAVYRQQVIGRNRLIMRWLHHRGGATDFRAFQQTNPGQRFPIAVIIGADPATTLAAVAPIPDTVSEYQFAGLLRGSSTELVQCISHDLQVPAEAEIVLEGFINPGEEAEEGPFGDHTGYYNSVQRFPVFTVERITRRHQPLYTATYMGRPPYDEPSVMASAFNEIYLPLLQGQFPEIQDFYLPPEACSYRMALVSIRKQYPGHARRVMFGIWSSLRQFTYTKFVIVTDEDINIRDWSEVVWAMSTRADPVRDTVLIDNTPIDYLDFASPESGLGGKMGIDATNKWPAETRRQWGRPIVSSPQVSARVEDICRKLGI